MSTEKRPSADPVLEFDPVLTDEESVRLAELVSEVSAESLDPTGETYLRTLRARAS
jgi:hypothetical protein